MSDYKNTFNKRNNLKKFNFQLEKVAPKLVLIV